MKKKSHSGNATQVGIIVKVRPAQPVKRIVRNTSKTGQRENESMSSDASDLDLDSRASTPTRVKSVAVCGQQSSLRKANKTHVGGLSSTNEGDEYGDDSSDGYTTAESSHPNKGR